MKKLSDVTLVATASIRIDEHIKAIEICRQEIEFEKILLISHEKPDNLPDYIQFKPYKKIENIMDYNQLVFLDLGDFIETSHALLCQDHAFIIAPELWDNKWLTYDYIGSPWQVRDNAYMANNGERVRVGNGGFSLRSKKLMQLPKRMNWYLKEEQGFYNEDGNTCCYWRKEMLENEIKYAPLDVAVHFSYENPIPENQEIRSFGFHRNMNPANERNIFNSVQQL